MRYVTVEWRVESGLQLLWLAFADLIDDRVTHSASLGVGQVEAAFRSAPLSCLPIALAAALLHVIPFVTSSSWKSRVWCFLDQIKPTCR